MVVALLKSLFRIILLTVIDNFGAFGIEPETRQVSIISIYLNASFLHIRHVSHPDLWARYLEGEEKAYNPLCIEPGVLQPIDPL